MQWKAQVESVYFMHHYNQTFINNTQYVVDANKIMISQTQDFTAWFRDLVIPPALAGYFPDYLWTDYYVSPPSRTYYQVEMISNNDFSSKGYLTPLLWAPSLYGPASTSASANRHVNLIHNITRVESDFDDMPGINQEAPRDTPPPIQLVELKDSLNATASALDIANSLPCFYQKCSIHVQTMSPCTCRVTPSSEGEERCDCMFRVMFSYDAHHPPRGWVGPYRNNSASSALIGEGIPLCTGNDLDENARCIPGLFIKNFANGGLKLFANGTYGINIVPKSNYEYNFLLDPSKSGKDVAKVMKEEGIRFQMYDSTWQWKYGATKFASYLGEYYTSMPYILENINGYHNTSVLAGEDGWRFYFNIRYGKGDSEYFPVRISTAATSLYSNSSFGFSCLDRPVSSSPLTSDADASSWKNADCISKEVHVPYPSHV